MEVHSINTVPDYVNRFHVSVDGTEWKIQYSPNNGVYVIGKTFDKWNALPDSDKAMFVMYARVVHYVLERCQNS